MKLKALRWIVSAILVTTTIVAARTSHAVETLPKIQVNGPCAGTGGYAVFEDDQFEGCATGGFSDFGGSQGQGSIREGGGGGGSFTRSNTKITTKPSQNRNPDCEDSTSDPIEISYGAKVETQTLFVLPGEMGLRYQLYFRSLRMNAEFTYGSNSFDYGLGLGCLAGGSGPCNYVTFTRPDGSSLQFNGNPSAFGNFPEAGGGNLATLTHSSDGTWTLHDEDATTQTYDSIGLLTSIKDASGVGWTIAYATNTLTATHTDGQTVTLQSIIEGSGPSTTVNNTVTDPSGNVYSLIENIRGEPLSITYPGSPKTVISYKYDSSGVKLIEVDYNGIPYSYTTYDSNGRANGNRLADNSEATSIVYAFPSGGGMTATITNPLGHTTTKQYNVSYGGQPLLTSISDSAVSTCGATTHTIAYDSNGYVTKTADNNGISHTYTYAVNGQLQSETEAAGTSVARKTDYVWDPNQQLNRLLSVTVEGESKASYAYNAQNRLASITRINLTGIGIANQALTTAYAYTLYGNGIVRSMTVTQPSPGGSDHTTYAYDTHGNLSSATDGLGHVTTYSNYNGLGEVGKIIGPNGDETDYTYDARGRVTGKTTHPNGVPAGWMYGYDGYGMLAVVTAPDGEITTWNRNAEMRVTSITHNDKDGTSTESFGYDANGDVTSDVVKRGADVGKSSAYAYDGLGRIYQVKGSNGQVQTYAYDGNGNVLSVTDALGHQTTYAYDALNRPEGMMNAAGGVTSYTYDAGDHLTSVTDPRGLLTTYSYDGLGQLWKQVSPDSGVTTFAYDTNGRLAGMTRASGNHISYAYDPLNRVTSVAAKNSLGTISRSFTWDTCPNGVGRLCSAVHVNDDTISYSYTPEGWLASRSFSFVSGINYALNYSYDEMGQLASVTYPDGNVASYDYVRGAVADVRLKIGASSIYAATSVAYRPMDLAMSSWIASNGLANSISYDADLRPISITVPDTQSLAFAYDAANRINHVANGIDDTLTQTYTYDAMSRLTGVTSTADNESFAYDADGNRTLHVWNGSDITFTMAPDNNRLISTSNGSGSTTYGYDADGNTLTANGTTLYGYGGFGLVTGANGYMSYANGAEGQRLRNTNTVARTQTYFAPDRSGVPLAEDQAGLWLDYVYLNGRLVSVIQSGQVYAAHTDQTGRPLVLTNSSKGVAWGAENLPYPISGYVTFNRFGDFNLGYPGQYQDPGIIHNGLRDYNAYLGRYMQSDPIGLIGGVNTYVYADNNPISNVDPLGLCDDHKCNKLERGFAIGANDADHVADVTGKDAAITGLAAGGLVVAGGGPEDPFTDVAAAAAGATSGALGSVSGASSITAGLLRTAASGGDFRYVARAVITTTLGHLAGVVGDIQRGLGWGASYEYATDKFIDSVVQPLPLPCPGVP